MGTLQRGGRGHRRAGTWGRGGVEQGTWRAWAHLVDGLLALLVLLGLLLQLFPLLNLIDELKEVAQVQDHRLGLDDQSRGQTSVAQSQQAIIRQQNETC